MHDLQALDQGIVRAQRDYERIRHDDQEAGLYRQFGSAWTAYRTLADRVTALSSAGHDAEAAELYRTASGTTYHAASDLLGRLGTGRRAELPCGWRGRRRHDGAGSGRPAPQQL